MIFNVKNASKKLIIVATPIGNIEEITFRAINALKNADVIFCEDKRITSKLLMLLKIETKQLITYNKINEKANAELILKAINNNKKTVLVSDAGYPLISDPGYNIVNLLYKNNISVEVINGPSALCHGIVSSGLNSNHFLFYGFLNSGTSQAKQELESLSKEPFTLIFYEAPHRILRTLKLINEMFGDRLISVARELSKIHETIYHNKVSEIIKEINPIGEFVIVVEGNNDKKNIISLEDIKKIVNKFLNENIKLKEACKLATKNTNYKANDIYNLLIKSK